MAPPEGILAPFDGLARVSQLRERLSLRAINALPLRKVAYGWRATDPDHPGIAAVRAGGRLTCVSSAKTYGLWVRPLGPSIPHVHIDKGRSPRCKTEAVVGHFHVDSFRPSPQSAMWRDTVCGTLAAVLRCVPRDDAIAVIDSALNCHLVTMDEVGAVVSCLPSSFRSVMGLVDGRAESGLETLTRLRLRRMGLDVRSQVSVRGLGRVDLLVQGHVIVELDGKDFHAGTDAFARDRERDAVAAALGYERLRFSGRQVLFDEMLVDAALRSTFGLPVLSAPRFAVQL